MSKLKGEEYIALPKALFDKLSEKIEEKAQFDEKIERYFRVCAFTQSIRDKNEETIFLTPKALEGIKKLYDADLPLPF